MGRRSYLYRLKPQSCLNLRVKKALPEKYQKRTEASLVTALVSASVATLMCYPLDTVRRQMQMRGTPYVTVLDAIPGRIILQEQTKSFNSSLGISPEEAIVATLYDVYSQAFSMKINLKENPGASLNKR